MRRLPLLSVLIGLALPAAASAQSYVLGPQAYYGLPQSAPLDEKAEPVNRPANYDGPPLEVMTTKVGRQALEPTIALDKAGNAFYVAGYFDDPGYGAGSHTYVMRSQDGNKTWQDKEPIIAGVTEDPPRDLDPWIYADPDFGRVFNIGLVVAGSYLSYTDDAGETWQHSAVTDPGVNDHQSVVTALAPDANTLLTPLDPAFPKLVYYCVNEVSRTGCVLSRDGGRSWISTGGSAYFGPPTSPEQVEAGGPFCSALTGHIQSDLNGRIMLPAGHCGQPYISVSEDGGTTWRQAVVSEDIRSASTHTETFADQEGNYYYVWVDPVHYLPWMSTSTDQGATWSTPVNVAPPGVHAANFPTIVAGENGRVAITFTGTTDADEESKTRPWNAYVVFSSNALEREPLFISNIANQKGDPIHRGPCRGRCGGVFDFADIQVSPADGAFWATSSDSCVAEDGCSDSYEGDLPQSATPGQADGLAIRQIGGPRLTGPLPPSSASPAASLPPGPAAQPDRRKPSVRLALSRRSLTIAKPKPGKRAKVAGRFTLRLSESATVTIRVDRLRGKKASRAGVLSSSAAKGRTRLAFTGKLGRGYLRRGSYRAVAIARDAAGNVGRSKAVKFRVR